MKGIDRGLLGFCGISPIRRTCIGGVDAPGFDGKIWIRRMRELGRRGE